jgi:MFS family permease
MDDIALTYREFYLYVLIGGAILGALFGIIPLVLGRRRNKRRLGFYGFLASIVGGAIAPLLAVVITAIFSWLIVRDKPVGSGSGPRATSGNDDLTS